MKNKTDKELGVVEKMLKFAPIQIEQYRTRLRNQLKGSNIYDEEQDCIKIPIDRLRSFTYDISKGNILCGLG